MNALEHEEPLVRGHVAWALGRLGDPRAKKKLEDRLTLEEDESVRDEMRWSLSELEL